MKAILVDENKNLVWSDVADPIIKDDEVLVKIHAAALNRADLLQRQGKYPSPAGCPEWMGLEIAGEIVEVGEAAGAESKWKMGDAVCALLGVLAVKVKKPKNMVLYQKAGFCATALSWILLSFVGKLSELIRGIPVPVMGGVCLLLFGVIAASGLRVLVERRVDYSKTANLVMTSVVMTIGLSGAKLSVGSVTVQGMVLATLIAIAMSLLFKAFEQLGLLRKD